MKALTDAAVIRKLQSDNEQIKDSALAYLYERVFPTVRRFILRNKGNEQDADDYFHEGVIAFYMLARQGKLQGNVRVEAYLFTICKNMWSKHLKKQIPQSDLSETAYQIPEESLQLKTLLSEERSALIQELLKQLGPDCRQILIHFYFDRLRMQDIVERMGLSGEQVAKNKKSACMKKLRAIVLNSPFYHNFLK